MSPDRRKVTDVLRRLAVKRFDAVLCSHSHMDHALDAPLVAELTGAQLVGSASTATVGRGWGLPEQRLDVVGDGEVRRFGAVECEFIQFPHTPADPVPGTIDAPLVPPARFTGWRMGGDYVFHPRGGNDPGQRWVADFERHEALWNRVEVGDLRRRVVAAAQ